MSRSKFASRVAMILSCCALSLCALAQGPAGADVLPPTGPKPMTIASGALDTPGAGLPALVPDAPGAPHYLFTANGQCIWWYVYGEASVRQRVYCGTVADLANVGSRVNTIRRSADPAHSLDTLPQRIAVSPLRCTGLVCATNDPALQAIVADLNAARGR